MCSPASLSRLWVEPLSPIEIIEEQDRVVIRHEYMDIVRTIPFGMPAERVAAEPSVPGNSVAWYEGSTLVIDSVAFSPSYLSTVRGTPQTSQLHTVERLTPNGDGAGFTVAVVYEDPTTFTVPWTSSLNYMISPGGRGPLEYGCVLEDAGYE